MQRIYLPIIAAVFFALPLSVSCSAEPGLALETVLKQVEQEKAVLVDVREVSEWKKQHIEDCVLLPLSDLRSGVSKQELQEKLPEKKVLYTYCVVGKRATTASRMLQQAGYEVRPLQVNYQDLVKAGFKNVQP